MGFKAFFNKLTKGQNTSNTAFQPLGSSDGGYPIHMRMHFTTKAATAACKLDTEPIARATLTLSAPIKTPQLRPQLMKSAPFLRSDENENLSARDALQRSHVREQQSDEGVVDESEGSVVWVSAAAYTALGVGRDSTSSSFEHRSQDDGTPALGWKPAAGEIEGAHCLCVSTDVAQVEESPRQEACPEELHRLVESLSDQESLSQSLRLQLLEREDEVASLLAQQEKLHQERNMLEAEQDVTAKEREMVQQQLEMRETQLAEEKARTTAAVHQLHLWRNNMTLGSERLIAQRDQAIQEAQNQYQHAQNYLATVNVALTEKRNSEHQLAHVEAMATLNSRRHEAEVTELRARLEHAAEALNGQQQQINRLVGEKDTAKARARELEVRVEYLVADVTTRWIESSATEQEEVNWRTLQPNEIQDLRQAFALSQARLATSADVNEELRGELLEKEKELVELREKNELLRDKAARLSSTFDLWKEKLDNWMLAVPGIAKMKETVEEVPGLKELLDSSVFHEQRLAEDLKTKVEKIADLEAANLKLRQTQRKETEALEKRTDELQEENIRLDARNFEVVDGLDEAKREIEVLHERLLEATQSAEEWQAQCEEKAFGDSAAVIRGHHEQLLKIASDMNAALHHRLGEYYTAKEMAESDLSLLRGWLTEELAKVSEVGAQRDWYRKQVDALRERFHHELLVEQLEIPYHPAFSNLSPEDKEEILSKQDHAIARITTMAPLRSLAESRDVEIPDLWATSEMGDGGRAILMRKQEDIGWPWSDRAAIVSFFG
ncbi:hypothetical protein ABEF95_010309 [Exophiala dermatitidis]